METIRILIFFAANVGCKIFQIDVISEFLNRNLKEEIYVKQFQDFKDADFPYYV